MRILAHRYNTNTKSLFRGEIEPLSHGFSDLAGTFYVYVNCNENKGSSGRVERR